MHDSIISDSVRSVLARLARGADDRSTALSLILLLRSLRSACAEGLEVEVCGHEDGVLVTIDDQAVERWIGEILPVSMRALHEVLVEHPELLRDLERTGFGEAAVVRVRRPTMSGALAIETPFELPSAELVLATSRATWSGEV